MPTVRSAKPNARLLAFVNLDVTSYLLGKLHRAFITRRYLVTPGRDYISHQLNLVEVPGIEPGSVETISQLQRLQNYLIR
jgi:hypothetical protein